jgi:hypothetical protein
LANVKGNIVPKRNLVAAIIKFSAGVSELLDGVRGELTQAVIGRRISIEGFQL